MSGINVSVHACVFNSLNSAFPQLNCTVVHELYTNVDANSELEMVEVQGGPFDNNEL